MKKTTFLIALFLTFAVAGFAKPRTSSEALSLANSFRQAPQNTMKRMSSGVKTLKLAYTCTDGVSTRSSNGNSYYYVFNVEDNNGFIIVSGDDRAKNILGYADNGSFDIDSIPENFKYWLTFYQKELKNLMEQSETSADSVTQISKSTNLSATSYATSVAPLLGGIKWDQGSPYNNLCPTISTSSSTKSATGCVATAMAQVMRYYKWPIQGIGSNTYTPTGLKSLSVDFSKTTYDWENMTETYNASSTQTQINAVATLMYHCGVAVNMDYGESSGATSSDMAQALSNNFGYDPNLQLYLRDYYSSSEWVDLIKTELNGNRPVLYGGNSSDGGHQFVCDGYDSNDLFHFNWGWSGSSDGYFELSVLNPPSLGIGGGTSGGFNSDQDMVIGVQKPGTSSSQVSYNIITNASLTVSQSSINRTASFSITSKEVYNLGANTFSGSIGIALYNDDGFVEILNSKVETGVKSYNGWSSLSFSNIVVPSTITNGSYYLYNVYKGSDQTDWQIIRGKVGTANYLNVSVTSSTILFTTPNVLPKLTLNSFNVTGNLYQNKTGRFNVSITNSGEEYNSYLVLKLQSSSSSTVTQVVSKDPIDIPAGETKSFDLIGDITVAPGQYTLTAMYDPTNDRSNATTFYSLATGLTVNVLAEPTETPVLTLTSAISFPDAAKVNKNYVVLTAHVKNTGGYFYDYVVAFVFPSTGGQSIDYFGDQKIILDKNEEKTVTFSGVLDLDPDPYLTAIRYSTTSGSSWSSFTPNAYGQLAFTLVDNDATGIEQTTVNKLNLYPNPTTDELHLNSEEVVKSIRITDLSGKQVLLIKPEKSGDITISVEKLSTGTYILQSETETGVKASKFIKK